MKFPVVRTILLTTASLALSAPMAFAGPRAVDCDKGQSLQKAIDAGAGSAKVIEITVVGTCYEDIRIGRRGVRIYGDGLTTIDGRIRVFNSNSIEIRDLTITGPMEGLRLVNSRARLFNVHIVDNESTGIPVSYTHLTLPTIQL